MQHTATSDGDTKKRQTHLRGMQSGEMKGRVKTWTKFCRVDQVEPTHDLDTWLMQWRTGYRSEIIYYYQHSIYISYWNNVIWPSI